MNAAIGAALGIALLAAAAPSPAAQGEPVHPADEARDEARRLLDAGSFDAAEAAARRALELSRLFEPEKEIGDRPEKGLLFEDMIARARRSYRARRVSYFRALGDALAGRERWAESRKAYSRAADMVSAPDLLLRMADDPDLDLRERVDAGIDAFLAAEGASERAAIEKTLLDTRAFRTRNALEASLDAERFSRRRGELAGVERLDGSFPAILVATDAGTVATAERFAAGAKLVVYVPAPGCRRCSEELDGLTRPVEAAKRKPAPVDVLAFVPEPDLPIARRIARLMAIPLGVGRLGALPEVVTSTLHPSGEIRVVARGGLTQIRVPLSDSLSAHEIRRRLEAVFGFLDASGLPALEEPELANVPLVELEEGANDRRTLFAWIEALERLEAGPAPLDDLYERLGRLAQGVSRRDAGRELGFELLEALSALEGASAVKTRALALVGERLGERLLDTARELDEGVRRTAPGGRGVFFVDAAGGDEESPRRIGLQRSFVTTDDALAHVNFVLEEEGAGVGVAWSALEPETPAGVRVVESGTAFSFEAVEGCTGVRLVDVEVRFDACPAKLLDGAVVEVRNALVDELDEQEAREGRRYFRRYGEGEGALDEGLRRFAEGDFAAAAAAFERAAESIDPVAPYDASDLRYNRARALHELGRRQEALALYRGIGDVSYQSAVDEQAGKIESGR